MLLRATGMPPLRALYHSIHIVCQIQMVRIPTRSDGWLWSYLLVCTLVPWAGNFRLFAAECYKHATASSLIPFDSPRPPDSNGALSDQIHLLAIELPSSLYFCSPGKFLQIVCYRGLQPCHRFEPYTIRFVSSGGFKWSPSQPDPTASCGATF